MKFSSEIPDGRTGAKAIGFRAARDLRDGHPAGAAVCQQLITVRSGRELELRPSNPGGTPIEVFDGYRAALAANRAQLYLDIPTGPFYGFNRPGAKISEGLIRNWWRQAMMGSIKAGYECIKAFSETDFTADLNAIEVPVLVIHSEDDQIVPYADSAPLTVKLLKNGTLKTYKDLPHGLCQTHPEIVNPEILAFIRGEAAQAEEPVLTVTPIIA